ncbi:MAG: hypothetical protein P1U63_07035 [Coxiellaceae bacterium]|nr:hypothetical protein [Coxiellaceae bacterium]
MSGQTTPEANLYREKTEEIIQLWNTEQITTEQFREAFRYINEAYHSLEKAVPGRYDISDIVSPVLHAAPAA